MKQIPSPPFWGGVRVKKWSAFFDSGAQSPIFGHLKMGTFVESTFAKLTSFSLGHFFHSDHFFTPFYERILWSEIEKKGP